MKVSHVRKVEHNGVKVLGHGSPFDLNYIIVFFHLAYEAGLLINSIFLVSLVFIRFGESCGSRVLTYLDR